MHQSLSNTIRDNVCVHTESNPFESKSMSIPSFISFHDDA